jgi:hypothetical protein
MLRQRPPLRNGSLARKPKVTLTETQISENFSNASSPQDYCRKSISEEVRERGKKSTETSHSALQEAITCFSYQVRFLENFLQKIRALYFQRIDQHGSLYVSWPTKCPYHKNELLAAEGRLSSAKNQLSTLKT